MCFVYRSEKVDSGGEANNGDDQHGDEFAAASARGQHNRVEVIVAL